MILPISENCTTNETWRIVSLKLTYALSQSSIVCKSGNTSQIEFTFHGYPDSVWSFAYKKGFRNEAMQLWYHSVAFKEYVQMNSGRDLFILFALYDKFINIQKYTPKLLKEYDYNKRKNVHRRTCVIANKQKSWHLKDQEINTYAESTFKQRCSLFYRKDKIVCRHRGDVDGPTVRLTIISTDNNVFYRVWSTETPVVYGVDISEDGQRVTRSVVQIQSDSNKIYICECTDTESGNAVTVTINTLERISALTVDSWLDTKKIFNFIVSWGKELIAWVVAFCFLCAFVDFVVVVISRIREI